ncbi:MAG TPA: hypothetical protein VIL27_10130, partial [Clostridia bacterium]
MTDFDPNGNPIQQTYQNETQPVFQPAQQLPPPMPPQQHPKKRTKSVILAVFLVTALVFSTVSGLAVWFATRPDTAVPGSTIATTKSTAAGTQTQPATAGTFSLDEVSALPS